MNRILHRILHDRVWRLVAAICAFVILASAGSLLYVLQNDSSAPSDTSLTGLNDQQSTGNESDSQNTQDGSTDDPKKDTTKPKPKKTTSTTTTNSGGGATQQPATTPSGSSNTPDTTPDTTTVCNGQTHVAGGSDGKDGCWPGPDNTGVPDGVTLTAYSGPTTFSSGTTVIDGKLISDDLVVTGTGHLTVRNSKMIAHFDADTANGSLTIIDSEINGTSWVGATVGFQNVTILRSNIYGSQHSVLCGDNCSVTDSWLHDQHEHNGDHNNAYISNGGNNVTLRHNTLHCTPTGNIGGGCSSNASFFGDFAAITNVTIDSNLLLSTPSGGYCTYLGHDPIKPFGSNPSNVSVINNYFQKGSSGKCGITAAVTSFLNANGNVFSGNKYTDGSTVSY